MEGTIQHKRVDEKSTALPAPEALPESIHARSVQLSSERLRVIAKMDLVEVEDGAVTPVDYKHGHPREGAGGLELWPSDRVQLAVQGLVLRENGHKCEEGIVYYRKTGQQVRVQFDAAVMAEAEALIGRAWETARATLIPEPPVNSPKCPGCSLVGICLPDETGLVHESEFLEEPEQLGLFDAPRRKPVKREVRPLVTPRSELRPLYLNSQGFRVGKSGAVLQVKDKEKVVQEVRLGEINQVSLMGNVQISTQAVQALCESGVPVCYFSMGGWFYGITMGMNQKNVFLRRSQFRLSDVESFARSLARELVAGKIRNQRTLLQRNHVEPKRSTLAGMKEMADRAETAGSLEELLGIEGNAARLYFGDFAGMIKPDEGASTADLRFDFEGLSGALYIAASDQKVKVDILSHARCLVAPPGQNGALKGSGGNVASLKNRKNPEEFPGGEQIAFGISRKVFLEPVEQVWRDKLRARTPHSPITNRPQIVVFGFVPKLDRHRQTQHVGPRQAQRARRPQIGRARHNIQ